VLNTVHEIYEKSKKIPLFNLDQWTVQVTLRDFFCSDLLVGKSLDTSLCNEHDQRHRRGIARSGSSASFRYHFFMTKNVIDSTQLTHGDLKLYYLNPKVF